MYSRDCKVRILTQGAAAYRHESILNLSKKKTSPVVFSTTERFFLLYNRMLDGDEASSHLDMFSLEMFENIAYIMAKHADPSIPDSPEEWPDEFSTFSIYW